MKRIDADPALAWLRALPTTPGVGFSPSVWDDETWILHAMYERPGFPSGMTHDDVQRLEMAAGVTEPAVVNGVNLDEVGVLVGSRLGRSENPGAGWNRVRWSDLAQRLGIGIFDDWHYPCVRSFPYRSWPANIAPPSEGSLDREQLERLLVHLAEHSDGGVGQVCHAYYPGWVTRFDDSLGDVVLKLRLDEVMELYNEPAVPGSPINLWSSDQRWFVLSDWDLWGTRVSGERQLIHDVEQDLELETIRVPDPPSG